MDKKQKKQPLFCQIVTKKWLFFRYISNIKYSIFYVLFYSKYEIHRGGRSELTIRDVKQKIPHKKGGAGGMWVPPASYEKKSFY